MEAVAAEGGEDLSARLSLELGCACSQNLWLTLLYSWPFSGPGQRGLSPCLHCRIVKRPSCSDSYETASTLYSSRRKNSKLRPPETSGGSPTSALSHGTGVSLALPYGVPYGIESMPSQCESR